MVYFFIQLCSFFFFFASHDLHNFFLFEFNSHILSSFFKLFCVFRNYLYVFSGSFVDDVRFFVVVAANLAPAT